MEEGGGGHKEQGAEVARGRQFTYADRSGLSDIFHLHKRGR